MNTGKVKWFSAKKGYGFIISEDEAIGEVFVHYSGLAKGYRLLREGDLVEFDLATDPKGQRANSVRVLTGCAEPLRRLHD